MVDLQKKLERAKKLIKIKNIKKGVFVVSAIDYGALLRVNGEFINKNSGLFMNCSDTGYVCDKATYFDKYWNKEREIDINGNYYIYAGDENFMLCFYKGYFNVIHNNKVIHTVMYNRFNSETFYLDEFPTVKVEHLDKEFQRDYYEHPDEADKNYFIYCYGKKKGYSKYLRYLKRNSKGYFKYRTERWLATWEYNGKKYEVIFGYGIDPNENVWNDIKFDAYDFTDVERNIIDSWFNGN